MNQPISLKELVQLAVQRHDGASVRSLTESAKRHGFKVTYTPINEMRAGTYKSVPRPELLRAIAWLADVDASVAFTAAGQPVPGPPFAEELPPGVDNLSPKARKAAIDMLRVLVELNQDAAHASNNTDQEQPADAGGEGTDSRNARAEQKTGKVRHLRATDYEDNNIPLPANFQQLAADSSASRDVEQAEEWTRLGEESQDRQ